MKNKFTIFMFAASIFVAIVSSGCSSVVSSVVSAKQTCPYAIKGKCSFASETSSYRMLGYDFVFYNTSEKTVSDFTLVFYVYDENGESPLLLSNCIITNCPYSASPKSEVEGEVSLDKYVSALPEVPYNIENVYVSEIRYADGSVWSDNLGVYAF